MIYYNGYKNNKDYFEGWYFKQNNKDLNIAFIPSISITNQSKKCYIQVITDTFSHTFEFKFEDFRAEKEKLLITIKNNTFSSDGLNIDLNEDSYHIIANLKYDDFTILKKDIMGFFKNLPLLECKHQIISMKHKVSGKIVINDVEYNFNDSIGYIEKDYGSSFPKNYTWIQCNSFIDDISLFFSMATIPYLGLKFKGFICSLIIKDKEYRYATYNSSKLIKVEKNHVKIKKFSDELDIYYNQKNSIQLLAPKNGRMSKSIFECINGVCYIRLISNKKLVFEGIGKPSGIEIT